MTLDELLALLPDNTIGEISAADLRTIVTDLFTAAHAVGDRVAYGWSASDSSPPNGKLFLSGGWTMTPGTAAISETTGDGVPMAFTAIDRGDDVRMLFTGPANQTLRLDLNGPSVDQGTYREVPYVVTAVAGVEPSNTDTLAVDLWTVLA